MPAECVVGLARGGTERVRGGMGGDEAGPRLRRRGVMRARRCGDENDDEAGKARNGGIDVGREGSVRSGRDGAARRSEGGWCSSHVVDGTIRLNPGQAKMRRLTADGPLSCGPGAQ